MKISFLGAESLSEAISLVSEDLGITVSDEKDAFKVTVKTVEEKYLKLTLSGGEATITYGGGTPRFLRALATLVGVIKDGKSEYELEEHPLFKTNGAMVDMSRNAVMNVDTVKFMLRKMALMGLNTYMLYTEDTYEIPEEPFFGYMRGRYTKEEIRELDRYAIALGIELVPCIQFLGHLATTLRWSAMGKYKDTANVLFVGKESTYALIDSMLRSISECFTSRRLHMGMDETHDLGRGNYLDANGYREFKELYSEHLLKVTEMAKSYGFTPMIWSDMIIKCAGNPKRVYDVNAVITPEIQKLVPDGCELVFWDYYNAGEDFYTKNMVNHKKIGAHTIFAGGIWTWSGHCPHFSNSIRNTRPAFEACRKEEIDEIFATIWHNGSEASMLTSLAALAWYADYDYKGVWDEDSFALCFKYAVGESYYDFMALEAPELPHGGPACIARALTYNDPLVGLIDAHIRSFGIESFPSYYKKTTKRLSAMKQNDERFALCFKVITALSSLLENKATFGVRLKEAYDKKDNEALESLARECDVITRKIKKLRETHRESWMEFNKPFGWEVHDVRYGGLIMRFETAKTRIKDYLNGRIAAIPELEEKRLRLDSKPDTEEAFGNSFRWMGYSGIATASKL